MKTQIYIIIFSIVLYCCSNPNEQQARQPDQQGVKVQDTLQPLGFDFDSTKFNQFIVVIADFVDTSKINSSIRLEELNYDIKYSVYASPDSFLVIKFAQPIPYYLYFGIMGETVMRRNETKDCFALSTSKIDSEKSFVIRYANPNYSYQDREYFYGKFYSDEPFIINLWALIDSSINVCSYKAINSPFIEPCSTYVNKNGFKLAFLDNISKTKPTYTVCVNKKK